MTDWLEASYLLGVKYLLSRHVKHFLQRCSYIYLPGRIYNVILYIVVTREITDLHQLTSVLQMYYRNKNSSSEAFILVV